MRRALAVLALLVTMGGCAAGGGGSSSPSYSDPEAMSKKAWGPAGITSCGDVDAAATLERGHYIQCEASGVDVRFVAAETEDAAAQAGRVFEAFGLTVEQRGSWLVASDDQATLDKAVSALS